MYNRIFSRILDSSIWLEPDSTRIVWITLLAAMNEDGYCHFSAVENLAARARVSVDDTRKAIDCLTSPDLNSANMDHEGRRVERVPGGFVILNAAEHRKTFSREIQKEQTNERVKKFREKQKLISIQAVCACCLQPFEEPYSKYVVLDHDHTTLQTRAFLCVSCNKVVGQIELGKNCLDKKKKDLVEIYLAKFGHRFSNVTGALRSVTSASASDVTSDSEKKGESEGIDAESIYAEYPKKVGKPKALMAIRGALRVCEKTRLLELTKAYAIAVAHEDDRFIPYPATWYNQQRFFDDPKTWIRETSTFKKPKTGRDPDELMSEKLWNLKHGKR
jgi:Recombination endonuclease VII